MKLDFLKGHPKGLYLLFCVEMWERFSYYGMRALLVLYMVQYLFAGMNKDVATQYAGNIYGAIVHEKSTINVTHGIYDAFNKRSAGKMEEQQETVVE